MYAIVLCISLITRFERIRRQTAVEGERRMQQERIELSQMIHDTAAQTAYMIGMGIHRAMQLADRSNKELAAALDATYALSREAMWELRHPMTRAASSRTGTWDKSYGRTVRRLRRSHPFPPG